MLLKKWIYIVIGVLLIGLAGYELIGSKSNKSQQVSQLRTATVQKGNFQVNVSGTGTIEPVVSEDIKATVSDNSIDEVLVHPGDSVTIGEPIITFTDGSSPITAPASGEITTVSVSTGDRVQAGEVVAHLTNYTQLETVNQIDELDIPNIHVGQTATINANAFPNQTFTGKVVSIANEGTATNGVSTFDVTLSINNPQGLKVGMSDQANILTTNKNNVLSVPLEAVHTSGNKDYVILANGQRQTITIGLANVNDVEVTSGLTEGQVIQLPKLAVSSPSQSGSSSGTGMSGFGGFGGSGFGGGQGGRSNGGYGGGSRSGGNGN